MVGMYSDTSASYKQDVTPASLDFWPEIFPKTYTVGVQHTVWLHSLMIRV